MEDAPQMRIESHFDCFQKTPGEQRAKETNKWLSQNSKTCSCGANIQRNGGCNHMHFGCDPCNGSFSDSSNELCQHQSHKKQGSRRYDMDA